MFGAALRNLEANVALIDDVLIHTINLMAQYKSVFALLLGREILEFDTSFHLFEATKGISTVLKVGDALHGRFVAGPPNGVLGSQRSLVNFGGGRTLAYAADGYRLNSEGIGGAEDRTDIIKAPDIVEHDCQTHFGGSAIVLNIRPIEIANGFLFHVLRKSRKN